ncbi:Triosephosphate isomerase [Erysiphe necator]|uniref:Triosephosphate isomerase n=1 Tax=Uncinula necator TaxID=52586 RepID=A0A0B1NYS0_UNCNE|nr:Triosephosphate isomerase [Erysiphe necator]KHJ31133.1 putative triosephosphate isomerase [Erysiphe necator]
MSRRFFVGGNFKMNGTVASIKEIAQNLKQANLDPKTEVVVAPPSLYLSVARESFPSNIQIAAQNVFDKSNGAYTGEVSVSQLVDLGISWTILGHSERRTIFNEDDKFVASKTKAALDGGVKVIFCCGESLEQREQEKTIEVVNSQLKALKEKISDWSNIVIAYEPIWAIGTGKVASPEQAQEVHLAIREWLKTQVSAKVSEGIRIIYGGSVNENNCKSLSVQSDIDGFLVGGASLKPGFIDIINSNQ